MLNELLSILLLSIRFLSQIMVTRQNRIHKNSLKETNFVVLRA